MNLDAQGNAEIVVSMTMDAGGWQQWLAVYGNNPAILKREMIRDMPAFFLDDFNLEKNEMDRSWMFSFKAYGVCKVDKKGNWILETDDKDVDLTELGEGKYMYVSSPLEFGGQIQQTTIIQFPKESTDIEVDEDALGKTIFQFEMNMGKSSFGWPGWLGGGLMLAGLALMLMPKKKETDTV
jgi:hypothetical protein